jgi:hypothetical protein
MPNRSTNGYRPRRSIARPSVDLTPGAAVRWHRLEIAPNETRRSWPTLTIRANSDGWAQEEDQALTAVIWAFL